MAMGPGVCLEYGGMKRYKGGSAHKATNAGKKSTNTPNVLLVIIALSLVCLFFSPYTLTELMSSM